MKTKQGKQDRRAHRAAKAERVHEKKRLRKAVRRSGTSARQR